MPADSRACHTAAADPRAPGHRRSGRRTAARARRTARRTHRAPCAPSAPACPAAAPADSRRSAASACAAPGNRAGRSAVRHLPPRVHPGVGPPGDRKPRRRGQPQHVAERPPTARPRRSCRPGLRRPPGELVHRQGEVPDPYPRMTRLVRSGRRSTVTAPPQITVKRRMGSPLARAARSAGQPATGRSASGSASASGARGHGGRGGARPRPRTARRRPPSSSMSSAP